MPLTEPGRMGLLTREASPAIYLTLALGISFPFNLVVGIPLYHGAALSFSQSHTIPAALAPPHRSGATP